MGKTKRAENFTADQKMGLIEAIRLRQKVVESKRADATMAKKKQLAWIEISTEMAANFPERPKSEPKDLRELWRRLKTKAKTVAREKKIDMTKTGGGSSEVDDVDDETWGILAIIAGDLEQIRNVYDDDATQALEDNDDHAIASTSNTTGVDRYLLIIFFSFCLRYASRCSLYIVCKIYFSHWSIAGEKFNLA